MTEIEPLLAGLRVLDLSAGEADLTSRLLADLGADVLKVEPPGGSAGRAVLPSLNGVSIPFALHNANKRSAVLDPRDDNDCRRLLELAADADILVDSGNPGQLSAYGTTCEQLADRYTRLVTIAVSDFGSRGPRTSWHATDPVLYAMSTALSRSGPTTGTPVLPPEGIASATAAVQAAWVALVAYANRLRTGIGDFIDFARFDAVVLALDPPFGTQGQAATARSRGERWRGRPKNQDLYPIFRCRDGFVRLCVLSPRQWHGMRAWLGEPPAFQGPGFDTIAARVRAFADLSPLMAALFADQSMADLVRAGQRHGVPIAAVLTPAEALESEHLRAVGALTEAAVAPGVLTRIPTGYWVVDGSRVGYRTGAPTLGSSEPRWQAPRFDPPPTARVGGLPFTDLRIVDLGVIVAGGELSRLFGDLGAEVIKLESASYPDGLRQTREGQAISESFVRAHRNHRGLGLELRSVEGAAVFERLVAGADAVFANFKPGTLEALGFPYDRLRQLNPRLVLAESSAFGDSGPWRTQMGYGPLVRATTGVTSLWASTAPADAGADTGRHPFYDATTIFPDHVVGRITAIGALAAVIRRIRCGVGAKVHVSQAEAAINQLDVRYVTLAARPPGVVRHDAAAHHLLPCAGEDEWCVVSLTSTAVRQAAGRVIGEPESASDDAGLAAALTTWASSRAPAEVAARLQAAGVPAGPMNRADDLLDDPHLRFRNVFTELRHPCLEVGLPSETGPAPFRHIPPAPQRPAPLPGADTRHICRETLGMQPTAIQRLIDDGALFAAAATDSKGVPQ